MRRIVMWIFTGGLCVGGLVDDPIAELVRTFGLILAVFVVWEEFELWVRA